tara:strand:+ start:51 stop:602 length:552 start_codon:yes stop_codon:yes gene_type:complete
MDIEKLKNITETNIGKMIGDINNLDWMDFEKLKDDICFGTDISSKKIFLVIQYEIKLHNKRKLKNYQCFIRNIKSQNDPWTSNVNTAPFINTRFGLTYFQKKMISNIIEGKIVTITPNHFPCDTKHIGKKIATPETWRKKRAVEIIERNWLICRYDPRYKMCETVLMNNIEEAREEYLKSIPF